MREKTNKTKIKTKTNKQTNKQTNNKTHGVYSTETDKENEAL